MSIFEEHTEWISKGKLNKKVELGHLVLITTDQHQFIVDYKVMEKQKDAKQISDLCERIKKNFDGSKALQPQLRQRLLEQRQSNNPSRGINRAGDTS
ncbi:MAG: hypothetical protein WKG06_44490 [Segetibacter sp.]